MSVSDNDPLRALRKHFRVWFPDVPSKEITPKAQLAIFKDEDRVFIGGALHEVEEELKCDPRLLHADLLKVETVGGFLDHLNATSSAPALSFT